jgi:hypothetical protein
MADEESTEWFKRSPETQALIEYAKGKEKVTYEEMSEQIGRDIRKVRHYWETARKALQNDHKIHFVCVPNVGYQRVTHDRAVVDTCESHRKRKVSSARRTMKKLTAVDYDKLDAESKQAHQLRATLCFIELESEKKKTHKRIGAAIDELGCKALPLGKTLELFKS